MPTKSANLEAIRLRHICVSCHITRMFTYMIGEISLSSCANVKLTQNDRQILTSYYDKNSICTK